MKAMVLESFGIDSLVPKDVPQPFPGPGEVKVRMLAASLNHRDLRIVEGRYFLRPRLPLIPVSDGVGEVVAVGEEAGTFRLGERVAAIFFQTWLQGERRRETREASLGGPLDGVLREYAVFPATALVRVPEHLTNEEAATLPCAGVTAWHALATLGKLRFDDVVLIYGTGGVSTFALQFAQLCGGRAIVVSRSDAKLARIQALGAWHCIHRTDDSDKWIDEVVDVTHGAGVDHVVDVVGDLPSSVRAVGFGGTISQVGYLETSRLVIDATQFMLKNVSLQGVSVGPKSTFEDMNGVIARHRMQPVVDRAYPVDETATAIEYLRDSRPFGKVVIRLW